MRVKSLIELMQVAADPVERERVVGLELSGKAVGSQHLEIVGTLPNPRSLEASGGPVSDAGMESLRNHALLEQRSLRGTKVGRRLAVLTTLPNLVDLDLQGSQVGDKGIRTVGAMTLVAAVTFSHTWRSQGEQHRLYLIRHQGVFQMTGPNGGTNGIYMFRNTIVRKRGFPRFRNLGGPCSNLKTDGSYALIYDSDWSSA